MKSTFVRALRITALVVLLAGLAVWVKSGARIGWTQTSVVTLQHDEITGIEYPVRHAAFIAGIEVPLLAAAVAFAAAAASVIAQRRRAALNR